MADNDDDDHYLYAALRLQEGKTVSEVRKLLTSKKRIPADEARTMTLNVFAAQRLEEGLSASEVRKLLLAEKGVTEDEARSIVAELRKAREQADDDAGSGGGGGSAMRGWGITLLILGIGSFVLPLMGLQFRLLNLFGAATPVLGAVLAAVGVVLVILSLRK